MRVAAVLVVRGHDVGTELPDDLDELACGLVERHHREASFGQRRLGVALRKPGVDETEPAMLHAEVTRRRRHLLATNLGHAIPDSGHIHRRIEDVSSFATRECHDEHVVPLRRVAGRSGGTLARLVIGMGMHGHEP